MIELVVLMLIALCAFRGYLRGILIGVLSLVALVGAVAGSAAVAPRLATYVAGHTEMSVPASYVLARVAAAILIFVSLRVCAVIVAEKLGRTERGDMRAWNRRLGVLAGVVMGIVTSLFFLFAVDLYVKANPNANTRLVSAAGASPLRRVVSDHNPADRLMLDVLVRLYVHGRRNPEVAERLKNSPQIQSLLDEAAVQAVVNDQALVEAVNAKKVHEIVNNENLRLLVKDEEIRKRLFSDEMRSELNKIAEWAEQRADDGAPPAQQGQ